MPAIVVFPLSSKLQRFHVLPSHVPSAPSRTPSRRGAVTGSTSQRLAWLRGSGGGWSAASGTARRFILGRELNLSTSACSWLFAFTLSSLLVLGLGRKGVSIAACKCCWVRRFSAWQIICITVEKMVHVCSWPGTFSKSFNYNADRIFKFVTE